MYRTGCLYKEKTNNGYRYRRGVGRVPQWKNRFVAEMSVYGKRYRFRSTSELNCKKWLEMMREKNN